MARHVVVHQFDARRHVAGGIDGVIRDLIAYAPDEESFAVVGVSSTGGARPGRWTDAEIGGRRVEFLPVARIRAGARRLVPHTVRLVAGILRHRPRMDGAVVHSHRAEVGAILSALYPKAVHVQFIHGDALAAFEQRSETFWRFLPVVYTALERRAARRAAYTVVMSRVATERLQKASPNVHLGRNWYDGRVFGCADGPPPEVLTIGWVGRFEAQKDPRKAVEVLSVLAGRGVDFRAWLAGTGSLEPEVRSAVREHGLEGRVELPGLQTPAQLAERLRGSRVLLMTSLWEGIPRCAIESLASGVPVVSTELDGLSGLIREGETGSTARTGTAEELADLLLASPKLQWGRPVADSVAALDAQRVVSEIFAAVSAIVERSDPTA